MSTMDYTIRFRSDTRGTVTLTSGAWECRHKNIRAGKRDDKEVENSLEVRLTDGSAPNNLDELRTLNLMLKDAYDRNQKHDRRIDPVYVEWIESSGGTVWRSEAVNARGDWIEEALEYGYWTNDTQFADLDFTRVNYWEGPEAQLALTNPNGTANTSGLNVLNCNDGGGAGTLLRYNYFDVDGTAIIGDLPGATRIELLNNHGTARLLDVWIGQNYTDLSNFNHFLEAEDASGGSASASSVYSGGTGVAYTIADGTATTMATWTLSSASLDAAQGGYFKMLANFNIGPYLSHRYKVQIVWNTNVLWESSWSAPETGIHQRIIRDIATFQLPPWLAGQSSLQSVDLRIQAYQNSGSPTTVRLDFVQLTPLDGWRYLQGTYGAEQNRRIVDDGINDRLYQDDGAGGDKVGELVGFGSPLQIEPGKDQRFYVLMHANTENTAEIGRSVSVKLYYRPHRHTL